MRDYKETVRLPQTDFPLQTGEFDFSEMTEACAAIDDLSSSFILHDGPPYANGNLHIGHALNKVLKDITTRSRGKENIWHRPRSIGFTPGWDCHGLPIEWAVEKRLISEGKIKNDLSPMAFRSLCREFATGWIATQRRQFMSYGVMANWYSPYLTMDNKSEAAIVSVLNDLVNHNLIYRGTKPVLWSAVEETALAENEAEHKDLKTSQVWVRFPISGFVFAKGCEGLLDCSVPIWTTTPWTLPANLAIAYNPELPYGLYQVSEVGQGSKCVQYENFLLADARAEDFANEVGVKLERVGTIDHLPQDITNHPWHPFCREDDEDAGWPDADRWGTTLILPSGHVTDKVGTGFVHIAPEHGPEDFAVWQACGLYEFTNVVNPDGSYVDDMPMFGGMKILQKTAKGEFIFEYMNAKIIAELDRRGALIKASKMTHSYPHSWRSKAPLFYRATTQWFFRVSDIKSETLAEAENVTFIPPHSKNRFVKAIGDRPDWLISRQRMWGTPLALFVHKDSGLPLISAYVQRKMVSVMQREGGDAWWRYDIAFWFEGTSLNPDDYEMVKDVLDVWFDSGCSLFIAKKEHASVYIEGSDQHRGWFGSSALIHMGVSGQLPFDTLITHGFVLDDTNEKFSKSKEGKLDYVDPLTPEQICKTHGADVLRLWIAMSDYTTDVKINKETVKTAADLLRRYRNTFRYLLGTLNGNPFKGCNALGFPELEKYIISRMNACNAQVTEAYANFDFKEVCRVVMDFCVRDLSAFYFDVRKDTLYCDPSDSVLRIACINTLHAIFSSLLHWLEPIIPFTVWEALSHVKDWPDRWGTSYGAMTLMTDQEMGSYRFTSPELTLSVDWQRIFEVMDAVNTALNSARSQKLIGSSLEAKITLYLPDAEKFERVDAAEIFRVSQVEIVKGDGLIEVSKATGKKCARSWKVLPTVGQDARYPDLSPRDAQAVAEYDAKHSTEKSHVE